MTIKSNKKVSTGLFQGIHPHSHSLFKASDMIFHFPFSSDLEVEFENNNAVLLAAFLARGGMVDYPTDSMGTVKRVKNFKELS